MPHELHCSSAEMSPSKFTIGTTARNCFIATNHRIPQRELRALLPSIVAVHLLHSGFISYSNTALQALSQATLQFMNVLLIH